MQISNQQLQQQCASLLAEMNQIKGKMGELISEKDLNALRFAQQQQILDQYRGNIYTLELKSNLFVKMMEEKGIMAKDEFEKRWPLYLKNDVGVIGPGGKMEGELKVTMYGK